MTEPKNDTRISELEEKIHEEEKRFLMAKYAALLLLRLQPSGDVEETTLDEATVESLQVARPHVGIPLAKEIADLLAAQGHEVEELEEEESVGEAAKTEGGDEAEYGGLFDDNGDAIVASEDDGTDTGDGESDTLDATGVSGDSDVDLFGDDSDGDDDEMPGAQDISSEEGIYGEDVSGDALFGEDESSSAADPDGVEDSAGSEDLFGDDEEQLADASGSETDLFGEDEDEDDVETSVAEDDNGADGEGLFDDDDAELEEAASSDDTDAPGGALAGAGNEEDVGLFDDDATAAQDGEDARRKRETETEASADDEGREPSEPDEDAGVLFGNDIYSGNDGTGRPGEDAEEDTPGFSPTMGHDIEDTPGFTPTEGHEAEETPGFTPTKGHEARDTPGFTPTKGHEARDTPGFTPTEGDRAESPKAKRARAADKKNAAEDVAADDDAEAKRLQARNKERRERLTQAQEAERAGLKQAQQPSAEAEQAEEEEEELELDNLMHQIALDDLEQYLDISIIPDDRSRLERRWHQKMRDPSIRHLLDDKGAMAHGYALIPRVPRYFRGGQTIPTDLVNLLRSFPQLFDNVAHVISKYRAEPFFAGEAPELDWAVVAVEVLPESRGRNYMEQKTMIKEYAQKHQTNWRRIQRRRLIDALYDCIVVNKITKEQILSKTVDLTETKVGRQNFACINFGEKGIRINDVGRGQGHQQMGIAPCW